MSALSSNFHACLPLQLYARLIALGILWVSCVAYLIDGIVLVYSPFSSCVAHAAWDER